MPDVVRVVDNPVGRRGLPVVPAVPISVRAAATDDHDGCKACGESQAWHSSCSLGIARVVDGPKGLGENRTPQATRASYPPFGRISQTTRIRMLGSLATSSGQAQGRCSMPTALVAIPTRQIYQANRDGPA